VAENAQAAAGNAPVINRHNAAAIDGNQLQRAVVRALAQANVGNAAANNLNAPADNVGRVRVVDIDRNIMAHVQMALHMRDVENQMNERQMLMLALR